MTSSQHIAKHFNLIAADYDQYKNRFNIYYHVLKMAVRQVIPLNIKLKILDIGCGTGIILHYLQPYFGQGIDVSDRMIALAKQKYTDIENLKFKVHNIEKGPLNPIYDYILLVDVIEHLTDVDKTLHNIEKTMKRDTNLVITMANPIWEPLLMLLEKLHLKMPEGPHHRISETELHRILDRNNLRILKRLVHFPHLEIPIIKNLGLIYVYSIKKID